MLPRASIRKTNLSSDLIYLSLGSNMGDRQGRLLAALSSLTQHSEIDLIRSSDFYETAPQDVTDQPWFLNMAAAITTRLSPTELLSVLQDIERAGGRDRSISIARGPRSIDIDILLCGPLVLDRPGLTIPHPRLTVRRFVLEPLLEIAPDLVHPVTGLALVKYLPDVAQQPLHRICLR